MIITLLPTPWKNHYINTMSGVNTRRRGISNEGKYKPGNNGDRRRNHVTHPIKKTLSMRKSILGKTHPKRQIPIIVVGLAQNKENGEGGVQRKFATGMEKAEEKEHHLQVAMMTQKASLRGNNESTISIPTPKFELMEEKLHTDREKELKMRVHRTEKWIHAVGSDDYSLREDTYDLDEEDSLWLHRLSHAHAPSISEQEFERIIEVLENNSRKDVISLIAASVKLPTVDEEILRRIYDYWVVKRLRLCKRCPSASLIPNVPTEPDYEDKDPYVAFRKRDPDHRRRSVRIAFNSTFASSSAFQPHEKSIEEQEILKRETMQQQIFKTDVNSSIDGEFAFKRDHRCSYITPG